MDSDVVAACGVVVPNAAITWRFSRSPGPGGQGVNTTDSRVELVVDTALLRGADEVVVARVRERLGEELRIVVSTERSQLRNRQLAIERCAARIDAAAHVAAKRRPTRTPRSVDRERLAGKRVRARIKTDRKPPSADEG